MTGPQIEQVLLQTPPHERFAVAARLIALALAEDDLDEPVEGLPEVREKLSR